MSSVISKAQMLRGVNISGAEFGMTSIPGVFNTAYTFNSELTYRYFAARNLNLVRLQLLWERVQPTPSGPLDAAYLKRIKDSIAWAKADGNLVILDIHNFARYSFNEPGGLKTYVMDQLYSGATRITRADLADLWLRLSGEFRDEPTVWAYNIMNEPHEVPDWRGISQSVLSAIRNAGDGKLILIPGDSYSTGNRWVQVNGGTPWISDPLNNFMYEAHQYFDSDESGTYKKTFDEELKANPALPTIGTTRVKHFIDWCRMYNVHGMLGEYGVPTDPRWLAVLDDFLKTLDDAGMSGAYWAAGEWWGTYALSAQPTANFTLDRPQTSILLQHLAPLSFTSVSAASSSGSTFAPGAFMAGYGLALNKNTWAVPTLPWPTSSQGTQVEITDSSNNTLLAPLTFVGPGQINYLIPDSAALGRVNIVVKTDGATVARGTYLLERSAPTLFSVDASPGGPAAALIARTSAGGAVSYEYTTAPIDFGPTTDSLTLVLFGTGFRNPVSANSATLRLGNTSLPLSYVGPQPQTPGLDQINAQLPRSLAGTGTLPITFQIDGKTANQVTVTFK